MKGVFDNLFVFNDPFIYVLYFNDTLIARKTLLVM